MIFDRRIFWFIKSQLIFRWFFNKFGILSYIGPFTYIKGFNKIEIGNKVRIFPGARIEVHGPNASLIIKSNVAIGHNVHIICSGRLIIDEGTTISSNVFINDLETYFIKRDRDFRQQEEKTITTYIGKYSFIGVNSSIHAGTVLEHNIIVGANSFVKGHFDKYSVIGGVPAKVLKKL